MTDGVRQLLKSVNQVRAIKRSAPERFKRIIR